MNAPTPPKSIASGKRHPAPPPNPKALTPLANEFSGNRETRRQKARWFRARRTAERIEARLKDEWYEARQAAKTRRRARKARYGD